jgi:hypothetical protein
MKIGQQLREQELPQSVTDTGERVSDGGGQLPENMGLRSMS